MDNINEFKKQTLKKLDITIKSLQTKRTQLFMELYPCTHATRTGQKVKCKSCGGAEYIFCSIKQQKINENLCNSKCDNYMCGDE